jgi:hypothetical protein
MVTASIPHMARDYGGKLLSPNDGKPETITGTFGRSDAKNSMLYQHVDKTCSDSSS